MTPYGAELVETVARAIERTSHDSDEDFAEAWAQWNVRHNRTVEARAALAATFAALQTPSEEMLEAGVKDHRHEQSHVGAQETWRTMLAQVQREIGE